MNLSPTLIVAPLLCGFAAAQESTCLELLHSKQASTPIPLDQVAKERARLWAKFRAEQRANEARKKEHADKRITLGKQSMRYEYSKIGKKPKDGYPLYIALHGGGGAPKRVNDSQWKHMQIYYKAGVKQGIYLAARGMTNTWNLHWVDASFPCYDRLIENMILFEDVDPNRVYVLGFSAGGDGTYQIAPRMADRWAAANMSAGHPNGVSPANLANVPFLLQMGENDRAYGRNKQAAKYFVALQKLAKANKGLYVHDAFLHFGKPHNFRDNHPKMKEQKVLADPAAWLAKSDRKTVMRNTHAIAWLDEHTRNPAPERVIWDLKTRAPSRGKAPFWPTANRGALHYWLDLSGQDFGKLGTQRIAARIDKSKNTVVIEECGSYLRVLLRQGMVDLARPVRVQVGGRAFELTLKPRLGNLLQTMLDRGDPSFMFEAALTIRRKGDAWTVSPG